MALWRKMKFPMRRAFNRVATRVGLRKTGLPKLRHDVKACEYEDVRVMWNILNKNEPETIRLGKSSRKKKKKMPSCNFLDWVKRTPLMCRAC
ncbi:hypothetical protein RchiOBHm_Chr6g0309331 [Rosa chinensis]|uniref:Uncharacterized protein n=1 Tax=Rosa chinensis TaxID=74649 RepID=A0A2P6Q0Y4_ROSCH|nr:uncharacterized protein LOC112173288 [Rosa chinensis]PRQ27816.1 hypothetical protein RchiOBHm_Chr6g0309331 [Rosa chinensis]